jgi:hypothetical protein
MMKTFWPLTINNLDWSKKFRQITLIALALLIILNGADVITTRLLLAHGAQEANPLSGVLLASASLLWVKLAILGTLGALVIKSRGKFGIMVTSLVVVGMYATAILSNLLLLRMVM